MGTLFCVRAVFHVEHRAVFFPVCLIPLLFVKVSKRATVFLFLSLEGPRFVRDSSLQGWFREVGSFFSLSALALSEGFPDSCFVWQEGRFFVFLFGAKSKCRKRGQRSEEACDKALEGGSPASV